MKLLNTLFSLVLLTAFLVTACGAPAEDAMMEKPTEDAMHDTTMTEEAMHDTMATEEAMTEESMMTEEAMMESPAWFNIPLTNIQTNETLTIEDLHGKVVLVETLAVWCPNCLKQQTQVQELHTLLGERDDFVSIGLDVDPNEDAAKLKGFIDAQGFDWVYAVSPADVSRDLASLYGDQFLNPPSTPMLAIDRHGVVHPLPFGIKSADDLLKFIQPFLDESM